MTTTPRHHQSNKPVFLSKLRHNFHRGKSSQLILGFFCNFQKNPTQRKQSPKRRKLAQSGHPGRESQAKYGPALKKDPILQNFPIVTICSESDVLKTAEASSKKIELRRTPEFERSPT
jgi:hypothetical protein